MPQDELLCMLRPNATGLMRAYRVDRRRERAEQCPDLITEIADAT